MKHYRFSCNDDEDLSHVTIEFSTENECWDGYDGPMSHFFNFLRGCGFVFRHDDEIGIMDRKDNFRSATS